MSKNNSIFPSCDDVFITTNKKYIVTEKGWKNQFLRNQNVKKQRLNICSLIISFFIMLLGITILVIII